MDVFLQKATTGKKSSADADSSPMKPTVKLHELFFPQDLIVLLGGSYAAPRQQHCCTNNSHNSPRVHETRRLDQHFDVGMLNRRANVRTFPGSLTRRVVGLRGFALIENFGRVKFFCRGPATSRLTAELQLLPGLEAAFFPLRSVFTGPQPQEQVKLRHK
ncbi:uncharacterized protein V6R79_013703 [Siganus canaliculatus]